jgi:hypothetical protein
VYHFLTPQPGALASISGLDQVLARPEVLDAGIYLEPGQEIRPVRVGGDRAGFVVTGGAEREAALLAARQCEEQIVFDYN